MRLLFAAAASAVLVLQAAAVQASPAALTADEWRADLAELDSAIRSTHPRPFLRTEEAAFAAAVEELRREIPQLDDREIALRLVEIVAAVEDGHTRLALPRAEGAPALEFGHAANPPPAASELVFSALPVAFHPFADGLFIVRAAPSHAALAGRRVTAIGDASAEEALARAQRLAFGETPGLARLMAADMLSLPDALVFLGLAGNGAQVELTLEGGERLALEPVVSSGPWRDAFAGAPIAPHPSGEKFSSAWLDDGDILYARIDEIGDGDRRLADFIVETVNDAERKNARLVIDLRGNAGGNNDLNRTLVLALIRSDFLNRWGRTYVLTGPRTFSAAQTLVNQLEKFTRALFVGEPTGARPDSYGDSKRFRLAHSGLTLRVSTLHWSSLNANDGRAGTNPDLPAPLRAADLAAGRDAALDAVRASPANIDPVALTRTALERGDHYQVARYLTDLRLAPYTAGMDFSDDLHALGRAFEEEGRADLARFAYRYGAYFFPDDAELAAALESLSAR